MNRAFAIVNAIGIVVAIVVAIVASSSPRLPATPIVSMRELVHVYRYTYIYICM